MNQITPHTNGNGGNGTSKVPALQNDISALPEMRQKAWGASMAQYQEREHELETTKAAYDESRVENATLTVKIEGLEAQLNAAESRVRTYQLERDQAVRECADVTAFLATLQAVIMASPSARAATIRATIDQFGGVDGGEAQGGDHG